MQLYFQFIEAGIKKFYHQLNEKNRRLYAALEALKVGRGGISYIAKIVGCSRKTIARGLRELATLDAEAPANNHVRQVGGGRKGYEVTHPNIDEQFL